jgi:glycosyltransferase involved in cell wall biosynthesis
MSSLVSILTSCFEHESYLERYFDSLLEQTYRDVELIFYDDSSKDRSWAVAQGYQGRLEQRFHRVVMRRNEHNLGLLSMLARLYSEATGDIVFNLDSDDFLYPTKIEENVAFLRRHPKIGLVYSDVDYLLEKENRLVRSPWALKGIKPPRGKVFENLLHENFIRGSAAAYRRSLVEAHVDFQSYKDRGYQSADYAMFLDLSRKTPFGYIDRPLAVYRLVEGSLSRQESEISRLRWRLDYCRVKQDYIRDYGCSEKTRKRAGSQYHSSLMQLGWAHGSTEMFTEGYAWFLEQDPARARSWSQRVRRVAVKSRGLWRAMRWLEACRAKTS